jgi:peptide/nickel transport system substrate-binding protein
MSHSYWKLPKPVALSAMVVSLTMILSVACAGDDREVTAPEKPAAAAVDSAAPAAPVAPAAPAAPSAPSAVAKQQFDAFPKDGMPQYGGIMRVAEDTPTHLSHMENVSASVGEPLGMVNEQLLRYDWFKMYAGGPFSVEPGLAKSWKFSDDGTVWTFNLRDDVRWHDGKSFSCADAKATYEHMIDPGEYGPPGSSYTKPYIKTVECPDPYTLVLNLTGPTGSLLENLAYQWTFLVSGENLENNGVEWFRLNMVGTGPYLWEADKWVRDISWSTTRNPDYWEEGLPYLDGVKAFALPDVGSQLAAFETKRVDITAAGSPAQQKDIASNAVGELREHMFAAAGHSYLLYNVRKPPFDDPIVRKAMYLWIDRQEFLDKSSKGKGFLRDWLNPNWNGGYGTYYEDLVKNNLAYNPDKTDARKEAMELLAEAGYPDLSSVKIDVVSRYTSGGSLQANQILTGQLKDMGWDAELRTMEKLAGVQALRAGDYQVAYYGGHAGAPLPDFTLNRQLGTNGQRNYTGYNDPVYEKLLKAFNTTADRTKKKQILEEIDTYLQEGTYSLHVMVWGRQDSMEWNYVHGYEWLRGCCGHPHWRVWLGDDAPGR